jgi:hypothetical protein
LASVVGKAKFGCVFDDLGFVSGAVVIDNDRFVR